MGKGIEEIKRTDDGPVEDSPVVVLEEGPARVFLNFKGRELGATVRVERWADSDAPIKGGETILTDVEDGHTQERLEEDEISDEMRAAFRKVFLEATGETEESEDRDREE